MTPHHNIVDFSHVADVSKTPFVAEIEHTDLDELYLQALESKNLKRFLGYQMMKHRHKNSIKLPFMQAVSTHDIGRRFLAMGAATAVSLFFMPATGFELGAGLTLMAISFFGRLYTSRRSSNEAAEQMLDVALYKAGQKRDSDIEDIRKAVDDFESDEDNLILSQMLLRKERNKFDHITLGLLGSFGSAIALTGFLPGWGEMLLLVGLVVSGATITMRNTRYAVNHALRDMYKDKSTIESQDLSFQPA